MEKEDIVNYVMETPGNSNPAVLRDMLDSYSGGGGVFWVTFTWDDDTLVSDKTAEEIYNAVMAGQYVRGKHVEEHSIEYLELHHTALNKSGYAANFTYTAYDTTQGESGCGYGTEYVIKSSLDYVTVASWTWEVKDDS